MSLSETMRINFFENKFPKGQTSVRDKVMDLKTRIRKALIEARRKERKIKCIHLGNEEMEDFHFWEKKDQDGLTNEEIENTSGSNDFSITVHAVSRPRFFRVYY